MKKALFPLICICLFACSKSNNNNTTLNDIDIAFMQKVSLANYASIDAAAIADTNADDNSVKSFAANVSVTQPGMQNNLSALAVSLNTTIPLEADTIHKNKAEDLAKLKGAQFDKAYINAQVTDYNTTILLYNTELSKGNNSQVIKFARENLPLIVNQSTRAADIQVLLD